MATVNLVNERKSVVTGIDNVVIVSVIDTIRGGKSLDVSGFAEKVIHAGHPIIRETSTDEYKPMPLATDGKIESLGAINGGSGYTEAGTYTDVALTGGSGSGAKATIVVAGGAVTSVTITTKGTGYVDGNSLSAANSGLGGAGSGFAVVVTKVSEEATGYAALPAGHAYAGILIASISTDRPFAGIMIRGVMNPAASKYSLSSIQSALSTALPHVIFQAD